jgi:hypothetical protein
MSGSGPPIRRHQSRTMACASRTSRAKVCTPTALRNWDLNGAEFLGVLASDPDAERDSSTACTVKVRNLLRYQSGGYSGRSRIEEPTVTRSVTVASRVKPIIASGLGLRDAICPPTQSESTGRVSSSCACAASADVTTPIRTRTCVAITAARRSSDDPRFDGSPMRCRQAAEWGRAVGYFHGASCLRLVRTPR